MRDKGSLGDLTLNNDARSADGGRADAVQRSHARATAGLAAGEVLPPVGSCHCTPHLWASISQRQLYCRRVQGVHRGDF